MSDETEGLSEQSGGLDPLQQSLLEVLLRGGKGAPGAVLDLVTRGTLSDEQRSMLQLLLSAQEEWADEEEEEPDADEPVANWEVGGREGRSWADLEEMRRELADLREGNDTLAAALGACALCWGGDPDCVVCLGRGSPGYDLPDPALFNELVVPALRRVYGWQRANGLARTGRATRTPHDRQR